MELKIETNYEICTPHTAIKNFPLDNLIVSLKETFSEWDHKPTKKDIVDEVEDYIYYLDLVDLIDHSYDDIYGDPESECKNMDEVVNYLLSNNLLDTLSPCCKEYLNYNFCPICGNKLN